MYYSAEDLKKHLIFEEVNLTNMKQELEMRKLANLPHESLVYEIEKAQEWYDQLDSMFQKRVQGV
jgi:hypothetical protein